MKPSIAFFHPSRREDISSLLSMIATAASCGLEARLCPALYDSLPYGRELPGLLPAEHPGDDCRAVISLGGDGTFLKAARWTLQGSGAPVAGVNTGTLGFLAAWERHEFEALARLLGSGDYSVQERTLIAVTSPQLSRGVWPIAVNEVSVLRSHTSQMITVEARLNGNYLTHYTGDGLLLSTATGSTGYNLSAGGPILQPDTSDFVLTPVAPHTLTQRPLVLDGSSELQLRVSGRARSFMLSIDGSSYTLPTGAMLTLRSPDIKLRVIPNPAEDFASRLRAKLMWGANPAER